MAHHCNCPYCPKKRLPWNVKVGGFCLTAVLLYWKAYVVVQWLGALSARVIGP